MPDLLKKCSIVIPAYNYAQYLDECIQSCLNQTYKNIEIIVVDDCSQDNTFEVCKKYPVIYIRHFQNFGLPTARNTGIMAATGDRILTVDADDTIHPTMVEKCIDVPGVAVVGVHNFGDVEDNVLPYHDLSLVAFKEQNRITCCSMFDKADWYRVGGFDENMKEGREDWDFWLSLLELGVEFNPIQECLFNYRIHRSDGKPRMSEEADRKQDSIHAYIRGKHKKIWPTNP